MSIGSYTDLLAAAASWLARDDLTARIPDFVTLAEARFRRDLRNWLRTTLTATAVTADYLLPATVSEVLGVSYNDGTNGAHNFPLDLVTVEEYQNWMESQSIPAGDAGQLAYVDVDQDAGTTTLRFWPPASVGGPIANLRIQVVKNLPALSATQTTNALLRDAPDLYLNQTLAESAKFLQHDERVATWKADADAAILSLRQLADKRLYGGGPRRRKLARVF